MNDPSAYCEYACLYICGSDRRIESRHRVRAAAERAAAKAQRAFERHNTGGNHLAGFVAAELVGGRWVELQP